MATNKGDKEIGETKEIKCGAFCGSFDLAGLARRSLKKPEKQKHSADLVMWPILMAAYYRLSMREEKEMEKQFGQEFIEYRNRVPAFIPSLSTKSVRKDETHANLLK